MSTKTQKPDSAHTFSVDQKFYCAVMDYMAQANC